MSRRFRYIRRGYRPTPDDEESDGFLPDRIRDGGISLTREQRKFIEMSEGLRFQEADTDDSRDSRKAETKESSPAPEADEKDDESRVNEKNYKQKSVATEDI